MPEHRFSNYDSFSVRHDFHCTRRAQRDPRQGKHTRLLLPWSAVSKHGSLQAIAKFVMDIHMDREGEKEVEGEIDLDTMRKYVAFCKQCVCSPS